MVEGFAQLGHTVIGCARSADAIAALAREYPSPHRFDAVDLCDNERVERWAEAVIGEGGPPQLLLNNAGVINENTLLWETPPEEFSRMVDANVKGVFHVLRHFLPAMIGRREGVIVNFSSGWGRSTSPGVSAYCATKWAVEGLTRTLADELPSGMAAIALNPGIIHTEMLETCWPDNVHPYPSAAVWAKKAVPFLLGLDANNNGEPLTAPQ